MSTAEQDFERLMERPAHYNSMSAERQWEVDKDLGILDIDIPYDKITAEMKRRWKERFGA